MMITRYTKIKASTLDITLGEATCPLIRTGSTALGWMIRLNSLREILVRITMRMHFIPPDVLPAQAPITIRTISIPQKTGFHII